MEAARDIFYGVYDYDERSGIIDELLQSLDFHALSITLLATVASDNRWDHIRLAQEWTEDRARLLRTDHRESLAATVEVALTSPTFCRLGPDARDLLGVVAFFPQGIDEKNLDWLFPTISDRKIIFDSFCVLSLTYRSNGFITMLAPVRDYLCPQDPILSPLLCVLKDCYLTRLQLSVGLGPDGSEFGEAEWIRSEEANVERLLDVFVPDGSRNPADSGEPSAVSVRSQISMLRTVVPSLSTELNTNSPGVSSTELILGRQVRASTSEVHEPAPQGPPICNPQITGLEPHETLIPEWKRLISQPLPADERVSLITTIFSDSVGADAAKHLHGDNAQTFVDVIDEVLLILSSCNSRLSDPRLSSLFCRIDIGYTAAMAPEEVPGCFAEDMWSFRFGPKIHRNTTLLRPVGCPAVSRRVCGCLGRPTRRLPCCRQGIKNLCD